MADPFRTCCGCQSAMRRVFARGVELDWCQFCGGIYFDRGELERVLGRNVVTSQGFEGRRSCPGCNARLKRSELGGKPVDECVSCGGLYLGPDQLDTLAGEHVGLLPLPEADRREQLTFRCASCGELKPHDESFVTSRGLVCRLCVPSDGATYVAAPQVPDTSTLDALSVAANVAVAAAAPNPETLLSAVAALIDFLS